MFKPKLMTMAMVLMPLMALADLESVDGIVWTYTITDGKAQVGWLDSLAIPTTTQGAITIPSTLGGCPVASIGSFAFDRCVGLTSVTIPPSVTSIGRGAFSDCSALVTVTIPSGVISIDQYAFYGCRGLTSVDIPSSVISIGAYSFEDCEKLATVTMSGGVTNIADCVFRGCRGLASVTIPDGVASIGHYAFSGCESLVSVRIPSSVSDINGYAFSFCGAITSFDVDDFNQAYCSIGGLLCSKDGHTLFAGVNGDVTIPSDVRSVERETKRTSA